MDSVINMLAHISANSDRVEAAIVAFRMKPEDGEDTPEVSILTIGDDAVSIFGISELVKMQLFKKLGEDQ